MPARLDEERPSRSRPAAQPVAVCVFSFKECESTTQCGGGLPVPDKGIVISSGIFRSKHPPTFPEFHICPLLKIYVYQRFVGDFK